MEANRNAKPPRPAVDACADAGLIAGARAGEASAVEAIMQRINRPLNHTAHGVVPNDAEAQDVVQEAYLRLH